VETHEVTSLVIKEYTQKNEVDDGTQFIRHTAKKRLDVVMGRDCTRDAAQRLVFGLGERLASSGLECSIHLRDYDSISLTNL
jgi:hypothetical protein